MTTSPIKSILVVDDSRVARMLIRNIVLSIHPHWIITEAINGNEAIEKANLETPNYITMDFNMPDMNGIEASQKILQNTPKTAIVLFTSNIQSHTRNLAENLGIGFVGKPITEASVRQALAFFSGQS